MPWAWENRPMKTPKNKPVATPTLPPEIDPAQSVELLKELHILTRDGKLNQDSRRKLKQVYHLFQFIEKLLGELPATSTGLTLADHGAGKSYLGFIVYDLYFKALGAGHIYGIETRAELVTKSQELAARLGFDRMSFLNLSVAESTQSALLPERIDVVTALHACDTATDDAIQFGLQKKARTMGVRSSFFRSISGRFVQRCVHVVAPSSIIFNVWRRPQAPHWRPDSSAGKIPPSTKRQVANRRDQPSRHARQR